MKDGTKENQTLIQNSSWSTHQVSHFERKGQRTMIAKIAKRVFSEESFNSTQEFFGSCNIIAIHTILY